MAQPLGGATPSDQNSKLGGICGILVGILLMAGYGTAFSLPYSTSQADQTLADFSSIRISLLVSDILLGLAAIFAIPYYSSLDNALNGKHRVLARAATVLSIIGFVVTGVAFIGETTALSVLADVYAAGGASAATAVIIAKVVIGLIWVLLFGFFVIGVGLGVYGFVMLRSARFPRWLGYLGIVGALLSLVGLAPVDPAFYAFLVGFVLTLVWILAASAYLWRSAAPKPTA